VPFTSASQAI